jgi:hypothetical protein
MNFAVCHDFNFNPKNQRDRVERGWWVIYYGGISACAWLVPETFNPDLQ